MKKFVFASMLALASMTLVIAPKLQAQQPASGDISIKDPAEFNAYQMFNTQTDPKAKAAAGESFLKTYPQSVVKNLVLDSLIDAYYAAGDQDGVLSSSTRLLQVDPNNLKALLYSVNIKKQQCGKTSDAQTCDDAAALAQKGLQATKPAATSDDDWKKLTHVAFPIFRSTMALDDAASKKDWKAAQDEYAAELKLYTDQETQSGPALSDTLLLAQAFSQPGSTQDLKQACWFYARVWDFAPDRFKAQIEPKLEYYYKKYHGGLDGLDAVKQAAQATTFPPGTFTISLAKSPAEQIHDLLASTDPNTLALADKETVLAMGSKEDADKLWALVQGKETQVPGIVIAATADQIQVAVTQDAKDAKVADFIVNLKKPLTDAEQKVVVPGFEFKTAPAAELVGTYDTYQQVPATDKTSQAASIVLKDGEYVPEEKKKPTAAHHAPAHKPAAH
jgi:hypothetical protein